MLVKLLLLLTLLLLLLKLELKLEVCWTDVVCCCAFCTVVSSTMNLSIRFFRLANNSAPARDRAVRRRRGMGNIHTKEN